MNNKKQTGRIPASVWLLLAAALLLLTVSGTQTARAALTYYSETYDAQVNMYDIGVTLAENGKDVSWRNYTKSGDKWNESTGALLTGMLAEGEKVQLGRAYPEALTVRNSGSIDEYVRVAVSCYWVDAAGNKMPALSPKLIGLHLLTGGNGWTEDAAAATPERRVLYYTKPLPVNQTSAAFSDTLTVSTQLAAKVTETTSTDQAGRTTVTTTYDYNGVRFMVEAETDAVQTHNAADAIKSAWGKNVAIGSDGTLTLQ